ncbi:MAG: hypothetical protein R3C14_17150 [Caldilineaceae bacterium]
MRRIHILLTVQTAVILLLSVNRLSTVTTGYVAANEFLRWVDLNNMLLLPVISLIAFFGLKQTLEYDSPLRNGGWHWTVGLLFVLGVYLFGAGYGDHEVTNYLHERFCATGPVDDLCRIIIFNDDEFAHWVWFAGFILLNSTLMLIQALFPQRLKLSGRDLTLILLNSLFIALGIFANLAFETIGLDLYVVAFVAALALWLLWRKGRQPLLVYYSAAYTLGLIATALYKGLR